MTRRKILFITPWYPPSMGTFVRCHAKAAQRCNDVTVLHLADDDRPTSRLWNLTEETREEERQGIPTYRFRSRVMPVKGLSSPVFRWGLFRAFHILAKRHGPFDVIHGNVYIAAFDAALLAMWHRIPLVITEHASAYSRNLLGRRAILKTRLACRVARFVLPVSEFLQHVMEQHGIKARYEVVPNAIDTALFAPAATKATDPNRVNLLFVGDAFQGKGLGELLQAVARLAREGRRLHFDVVGGRPEDPEYDEHRRLAAELGISQCVEFHGRKTLEEVADFMRRADVYVIASRLETFCCSVAEALASGTPVVATRCGGPESFVSEECGTLAPPGDLSALTAALSATIDRLASYDGSAMARYVAERFGYEAVGAKLDNIYGRAIANRE